MNTYSTRDDKKREKSKEILELNPEQHKKQVSTDKLCKREQK